MWNRDSSKAANRLLYTYMLREGVGKRSRICFFKRKRGKSFLEGALRQLLCSCRVGLVVAEPGLVRSGTGGSKKKIRRRRITDLSPLILRTCIPWPGPHGHLKPSITRPWSTISTDSLTSINLTIRWTPLYSHELDRNCSDAHSCTAVLRSESRLALSQYYVCHANCVFV